MFKLFHPKTNIVSHINKKKTTYSTKYSKIILNKWQYEYLVQNVSTVLEYCDKIANRLFCQKLLFGKNVCFSLIFFLSSLGIWKNTGDLFTFWHTRVPARIQVAIVNNFRNQSSFYLSYTAGNVMDTKNWEWKIHLVKSNYTLIVPLAESKIKKYYVIISRARIPSRSLSSP